MDKLIGTEYLDHWAARMAKGPIEAGTEQHGDEIWQLVRSCLEGFRPRAVLEQGCAYGRMLRRIHATWPKAKLYGVDISAAALEHLAANWNNAAVPTLYNQSVPPSDIKVDMIYTCTVLQHVTDDEVLQSIADGFRAILNSGGRIVLYENIQFAQGGGGRHMRHSGPEDYMGLWPELSWMDCARRTEKGDEHAVMVGRKAA